MVKRKTGMTSSVRRGAPAKPAPLVAGAEAEAKAATATATAPAGQGLTNTNNTHPPVNFSLNAPKPTDKLATVRQDHGCAAEEIGRGDITPSYPSTPTTPAPLDANPDSHLRLTHENLRAF